MKNNKICLTEQELYSLIEESVIETLNEGKFSDWLTAAALGGGLAAAGVGTMAQDPKYSDSIDMPSHEISVQPEEDDFETDIEPKYISSEEDFYEDENEPFNENVKRRVNKIISEEISKVLS